MTAPGAGDDQPTDALLRALRLVESRLASEDTDPSCAHFAELVMLEFVEVPPAHLVGGLVSLSLLLTTDLAAQTNESAAEVLARVRRVLVAPANDPDTGPSPG